MQIGIDLGGTKTEAIALEQTRLVVPRRRIPTPRDYGGTLEAIVQLVAELEAESGARGTVGVGIPGVVSRSTGLVKNANSTWLNGRPLRSDLEARLERPVRLANDANCFALSEAVDGAGQGFETVFGVILGTGVGGGIAFRRRIHGGANQIAGEWGHNPLPWMTDQERREAQPCYCGQHGCIETFLSGPGFERDYARASGARRTSEEIARAAGEGDVIARETLQRYQNRLARSLAAVINVLDPDAVVLGGGMSNLPRLDEAVSRVLPGFVFSDTVVTRVLPNLHGDSSGVRGAAWLWAEETDYAERPS
jgi:fructokinase